MILSISVKSSQDFEVFFFHMVAFHASQSYYDVVSCLGSCRTLHGTLKGVEQMQLRWKPLSTYNHKEGQPEVACSIILGCKSRKGSIIKLPRHASRRVQNVATVLRIQGDIVFPKDIVMVFEEGFKRSPHRPPGPEDLSC